MVNKISTINRDLGDGTYEIVCDNVVLTELEIITKEGGKRCWLVSVTYNSENDNYTAVYKSYTK